MTKNFRKSLNILFIMMTLSFLWTTTKAEFFTAMADIEPLLKTHKRVIENLDEYIAKDENRLAALRKHLNIYKKEQMLATEDISGYLGNPINAFTLIKRLTKDLDFIQNNLFSSDFNKNVNANNLDVIYPKLEDLSGAIEALSRLQDTYRLNIGDLAEGRLIGRNSRGPTDTTTS